MGDTNFSIAWGDFQINMTNQLKQYIGQRDFSDITLVTKDNKRVPAHKIILSSGSSFFRGLFAEDLDHPHPLLYLRGVEQEVLCSVLEFLYHGQVKLRREVVKDFFAIAEELGVEGLVMDNDQRSNIQNETKCSLEEVSCESGKDLDDGKRKTGSMISHEDDWFKEVNHQNNDTNEVNALFPIQDGTINLSNQKLPKASEDLCKHTQLDNESNMLPFHCKVCCLGFEKKNQLNQHYNSHTEKNTLEKVSIPKISPDGLYKCSVCESTFNNISNYRRHFQRTHIKNLIYCDECDFSSTQHISGLKRHKLSKHSRFASILMNE